MEIADDTLADLREQADEIAREKAHETAKEEEFKDALDELMAKQ